MWLKNISPGLTVDSSPVVSHDWLIINERCVSASAGVMGRRLFSLPIMPPHAFLVPREDDWGIITQANHKQSSEPEEKKAQVVFFSLITKRGMQKQSRSKQLKCKILKALKWKRPKKKGNYKKFGESITTVAFAWSFSVYDCWLQKLSF